MCRQGSSYNRAQYRPNTRGFSGILVASDSLEVFYRDLAIEPPPELASKLLTIPITDPEPW